MDERGAATAEWMQRVFEATKSWGRWGADDEAGALNAITPAMRAAAAALVRDGVAVSCARELPVEPSVEKMAAVARFSPVPL